MEECGKCSQNYECDKSSGVCSNGCDSIYTPPLCKKSKYTVHIEIIFKK
jgi:hypothetical protein